MVRCGCGWGGFAVAAIGRTGHAFAAFQARYQLWSGNMPLDSFVKSLDLSDYWMVVAMLVIALTGWIPLLLDRFAYLYRKE